MNVLLYDKLPSWNIDNYFLISSEEKAASCRGCFGCWLKTPGSCVMKDRLENAGSAIMQAENFVIISRCCYGGFSPNIKKVLDRSISGIKPFFVNKHNKEGEIEQHHAQRFDNMMNFTVYFYGNIEENEKELAKKIVFANGLNYWAKNVQVNFISSIEEVLL